MDRIPESFAEILHRSNISNTEKIRDGLIEPPPTLGELALCASLENAERIGITASAPSSIWRVPGVAQGIARPASERGQWSHFLCFPPNLEDL